MSLRNVVILGGYGTFGRLIAEALSHDSTVNLKIAGRHPARGEPFAAALGIDYIQCDAGNSSSLKQAIEDAWLLINASGPFRAGEVSVPRACIDAGCHYFDLADNREYVAEIHQLDRMARECNVFVCAGASTTPAITSCLIDELRPQAGKLRSIRIGLNAGNKNPAGVSTIAAILMHAGRHMRIWNEGTWQIRHGWGDGEFLEFPPPVGRRRVQWCDVPDLELFPQHFDAQQVSFKAGVELVSLNCFIGGLARVRRVCPWLNLSRLARPLVSLSHLFKPFGTLRGSCAVWVTDFEGRTRSIALVAHENGPRIPASPAILIARKLIAGEFKQTGAFPCVGLLRLEELSAFLAPYHIEVVYGEDGCWNKSQPRSLEA